MKEPRGEGCGCRRRRDIGLLQRGRRSSRLDCRLLLNIIRCGRSQQRRHIRRRLIYRCERSLRTTLHSRRWRTTHLHPSPSRSIRICTCRRCDHRQPNPPLTLSVQLTLTPTSTPSRSSTRIFTSPLQPLTGRTTRPLPITFPFPLSTAQTRLIPFQHLFRLRRSSRSPRIRHVAPAAVNWTRKHSASPNVTRDHRGCRHESADTGKH